MKTEKLLLLLGLLMFLSLSSAAQSDYRPGYLVVNEGDTLRGFVSYRPSILSDNTCGFKKSEQDSPVTYTPQDIAGYGFPNDRNFQTKVLNHADTLAAEPVFMEELVRGNISLYNYKGTFFVDKQDNREKLHKLYIKNEQYYNDYGMLAIKRVNHHVSVLNILMQDCFPMLSRIERVKLAEKSMVDLVKAYNKCTGNEGQIVFKESKPWIAARAGIISGISHTSLNFSAQDERYLHLEHASFNTQVSPILGLALNLRSPRISDHVSLQLEGQYLKNTFRAQPSYTWFGTQYDNEIEFDLSAVKFGMAARYGFSGKLFQPYVNAGTFFNFYQQRNYKHRQFVKRTSTSNPEERIKDDPSFVAKRQQGLMVGAGTYVNALGRVLSAELRYELGLDLHAHEAANKINKIIDSDTRTISVLVGFHF